MKRIYLIIVCFFNISIFVFGQECGSHAQEKDSIYTLHYGRGELLSDVYKLIKNTRLLHILKIKLHLII